MTVKLSASEKAAVQSAAARRKLSVAAYVAETALAAAEGLTVPVGDTEREVLRELMRVGNLLFICRAQLVEAAGRQEATGVPGADLESVAACCKQAGARAQDAAIKLSRTLLRRTRLRMAAPEPSGDGRLRNPCAYLGSACGRPVGRQRHSLELAHGFP